MRQRRGRARTTPDCSSRRTSPTTPRISDCPDQVAVCDHLRRQVRGVVKNPLGQPESQRTRCAGPPASRPTKKRMPGPSVASAHLADGGAVETFPWGPACLRFSCSRSAANVSRLSTFWWWSSTRPVVQTGKVAGDDGPVLGLHPQPRAQSGPLSTARSRKTGRLDGHAERASATSWSADLHASVGTGTGSPHEHLDGVARHPDHRVTSGSNTAAQPWSWLVSSSVVVAVGRGQAPTWIRRDPRSGAGMLSGRGSSGRRPRRGCGAGCGRGRSVGAGLRARGCQGREASCRPQP